MSEPTWTWLPDEPVKAPEPVLCEQCKRPVPKPWLTHCSRCRPPITIDEGATRPDAQAYYNVV